MARHQGAIFNVCYRMLGERQDAEDLTQEAFLRAHRRLETFDAERSFLPWMRKVAANLCLNHLRSRKAAHLELDEERDAAPVDAPSNPEAARLRAERAQAVRAALLDLPPHYRAVVELRHFQELSYAEISEALGIPLSDVKSHLFRARRKLSERLSAYA